MGLNMDEQGRPWTISGGGPIVVIPVEIAERWRGILPPLGAEVPEGWTWGDAGGPECDYDRACDAPVSSRTPFGGFGWIDVQGQPVLILDAEILTRFEAESEGGFLVRPSTDEGDDDPRNVPASSWHSVGERVISLTDGRLYMFDSAAEGSADPDQISANDGVGIIKLGAGRWSIDFATNADEVDFVRFLPVGGERRPS
ncbi:hypothetical protein [Streptomyces wedmorensis]